MDQGQVEGVEAFEFRFVEDEAPRLVGGKTISMPVADLAAVRAGDHSALVRSLLALAASWFESAGSSLAFPCPATEIANHGNSTGTGMLAAAVDLRKLLCASPQAREILRELGLDRYLADVESFPAAEPKPAPAQVVFRDKVEAIGFEIANSNPGQVLVILDSGLGNFTSGWIVKHGRRESIPPGLVRQLSAIHWPLVAS